MNINDNDLDSRVMKMLLEGDDLVLHTLRQQLAVASVKSRKMTGAGFFLTFHVPADAPRLSNSGAFSFGDVGGHLEGQQDDVGFVLHIKSGGIDYLEGYTYGNSWPEQASVTNLSYIGSPSRKLDDLPWRKNGR